MGVWLVDEHHPILHAPSEEMGEDDFGPELYVLLKGMLSLMYAAHGIGLAAPQIGIGRSVIAWDTGNGPSFAMNPVITATSAELSVHLEGCLSLPERAISVERPRDVDMSCLGLLGEKKVIRAGGLLARVLQHEIDHLRGVLMCDHADEHLRGMARPQAL